MDREKLNKAAYEETNTGNPYEQFDTWYVRESFKHGADWLMQQPIQERLTEAEKERIKEIIKYPQRYTELIKGTMHFQAIGIQKVLIEIFGPDLFRDK